MVKIIDAPCGYGKTQWAIQFMNETEGRKFIFITPYLDEVSRIKLSCPLRKFKEPSNGSRTKSADLKRLLAEGHNIVATHSLFLNVDEETAELFKMNNYTLILDEVMEVVKEEHITADDFDMLTSKYITVGEDGCVGVTGEANGYAGKFEGLIRNAKLGRIVKAANSLLIWQFPADVFPLFREVYNLTYLFKGQIQKAYYELHRVPLEMCSVTTIDDRYKLIPFEEHDDSAFKESLKKNIDIYQGDLNKVGSGKYDMSVTWYEKRATPAMLKTIQRATYNYLRNIEKGKAQDNMWTCFKAQKKQLSGNGYAKGHVAHNARATNKYSHKKHLAYLVNRFPRKPILDYFGAHDVAIDDEAFALSELIQWIWRSRIRDGKSITLFLPSSRMRRIFTEWLYADEYELAEQTC